MPGAYARIIEHIFFSHYRKGANTFAFGREEILEACRSLKMEPVDNPGDVLYSFRYRNRLPKRILATLAKGEEWIIRGSGPGRYKFLRVPETRIEPKQGAYRIKVPDATPEIVAQYALSDEQALLAKVRYNRLVDIFAGITTYSLQNHLRTQVDGVQIEVDELYVGIGKTGAQFILPVQAKAGRDRIGRVQLEQDIAYCEKEFPKLICRPIAAQFMTDDLIALFELTIDGDEVSIVDERHYLLVPADQIGPKDLETMSRGLR